MYNKHNMKRPKNPNQPSKREFITELAVIPSALTVLIAGTALTVEKMVIEPQQDREAMDIWRAPEEGAICTTIEFDAETTGEEILARFPDRTASTNEDYRLRAITGLVVTQELGEPKAVHYCSVPSGYYTDTENTSGWLEQNQWDLYTAEAAANAPSVSVQEFEQALAKNR